jgi:hypothetical protein
MPGEEKSRGKTGAREHMEETAPLSSVTRGEKKRWLLLSALTPAPAMESRQFSDSAPIPLPLPQGIASDQDIIDHAQKRDGIRNQINWRDDVEQRDNQHHLGLFVDLKLGVAEHLVGQLQVRQVGFHPLAFRGKKLIPLPSDPLKCARLVCLRLPCAMVEDVFDLRLVYLW